MVETIHLHDVQLPDGMIPANQDGEVERFERWSPAALVEPSADQLPVVVRPGWHLIEAVTDSE